MSVIEHYNKFGRIYCERAASIDLKDTYDRFLKYFKKGSTILDAGCGPGRDTKSFLERGFIAQAIDGSEEVVKLAAEYLQKAVACVTFEEMEFNECFDGIWANASLLHFTTDELKAVFPNFISGLKPNGYWFMSFRYGKGVAKKGDIRCYLQTEDSLKDFLEQFPQLHLEEMWVVVGVNARYEPTKWINCIVKKQVLLIH